MSDLDTALRSMLGERAQDVTSVPSAVLDDTQSGRTETTVIELASRLPEPPRRRRRAPIAAAASIVGVLALAGVGIGLRSTSDQDEAFSSARAVCTTTLPASWRTALTPTPLRIDGYPAGPESTAADGDVLVNWIDDAKQPHWAVVDHSGDVLRRYTPPAGHVVVGADLGDGYAVLRVQPGHAGRARASASAQARIVVIDVTTGHRQSLPAVASNLVAGAEQPVLKDDLAIQNNTVYWTVAPRSQSDAVGVGGELLAYSIAKQTTRVVRRIHGYADVGRDGRGIFWNAGANGIPARPLPLGVPRFHTPRDWAWSDGSSYAWNGAPYSTQWMAHVLAWTNRNSTVREFRIDLAKSRDPDHNDAPVVGGVSGSFVFFSQEGSADTGNWVLDTRSGAVASVPLDVYQGLNLSAENGLITFADVSNSAALLVDLHGLPALHC